MLYEIVYKMKKTLLFLRCYTEFWRFNSKYWLLF